MNPTSKRTVVVTGGSGSLGRAICTRFAKGGDTVFVGFSAGKDRADALVAKLAGAGLRAHALHIDLTQEASVEQAFRMVADIAGPTDVLINNAGIRPIAPFLELGPDDWERVLSVNLLGAVRCCRQVLPAMKERHFGRIINVSGLDALCGWGNRAHVTVSKAGLMGLTRAVAVEFTEWGITANTIVPGSFRTERDPKQFPNWEEMRKYLVERIPMGRQGEPEELAEWCWFLASPEAGYFTGQDVHLNGGAFPLLRNPFLQTGPGPR